MARRTIDARARSARAQRGRGTVSSLFMTTTGRKKNITGSHQGGGIMGSQAVNPKSRTHLARNKKGFPQLRVPSGQVRLATRGESTRAARAEKVALAAGMRGVGLKTYGQQRRQASARGGIHGRSPLLGAKMKTGTRSRNARAVKVLSRGRSKAGARRIYKRDLRGRFA